jgi:competence protein ComEC
MFKSNKKTNKKIVIILVLLSGIIYLSGLYFSENKKEYLKVSLIDVGQGDAIFIRTPEKHNVIIDFGSPKGISDLEKLIPWWEKEIDLIIITHPHDDHIAGIPEIIKRYRVGKIIYTGVNYESSSYSRLLEKIEKEKIPLMLPRENQVISLGENCFLSIIFPWENLYKKNVSNLNNSSIVSQLNCNNSSFLFMGDAELEAENKILEKGLDIKSDVLKVGHHGSMSSSQEAFLKKVSPTIAIIMAGENNSYGHPNLRVLRRLESLGIKTLRTDLDGSITIISDGERLYQK